MSGHKLLVWLYAAYEATKLGGSSLVDLSQNVPDYSFFDPKVVMDLEDIISLMASNQWNSNLSSLISSLCDYILEIYF